MSIFGKLAYLFAIITSPDCPGSNLRTRIMDVSQIEKFRVETPGCRHLVHFNNAGSALSPQPVIDALASHLQLEQQLGGYEAAEQNAGSIQNYYLSLARLFHCQTDEIAWMENSTRAWNTVFQSINLKPGEKVLTGQSEYASNLLAMLHMQKRTGIHIEVIPNDENGIISLDRLVAAIDPATRLIALTHIPSQLGVVQPAHEVGKIAADNNLLFLLDASQSAGHIPVDVQEIGCHMLTGSGRKYLRGPRGTGFLYVSKKVIPDLDPPSIDLRAADWLSADGYQLHGDARRFENWECYVAGKIALGVAVDYALEIGIEKIQVRIRELSAILRSRLQLLDKLIVHEPANQQTGIVTFTKANEPAQVLQQRLRQEGINIGVSKRANAQLDFARRGLGDINRISLHYYNTEAEIDKFSQLL